MPVYIWLPALVLAIVVVGFFRPVRVWLGERGVRFFRHRSLREALPPASEQRCRLPSGSPESVLVKPERPVYRGITFIQLARPMRLNEIEWALYRLGLCVAPRRAVENRMLRHPDEFPHDRVFCDRSEVLWRGHAWQASKICPIDGSYAPAETVNLHYYSDDDIRQAGVYVAALPIPNPCHTGTGSLLSQNLVHHRLHVTTISPTLQFFHQIIHQFSSV